ncbi:MAG: outer membrane protein assembly factor BamE [Methylovulum sp.]|nr:outer membrane protein assembly factor BamE [Methylovulum sp.]
MKSTMSYAAFSSGLLRWTCRSVVIALFLAGAGCASMGHEFPAGQVQTIRIGETTQNDIINTFGTPWRTGIENGLKTWTYGNYSYSAFSDSETEDLVIKFDKRGLVSTYSYNSTKRAK